MNAVEIPAFRDLGRASVTRPWIPDEYVVVDGRMLVYDWDSKRRMVVHMLGGTSALAEDLIRGHRDVRMPRLLRGQPPGQS